jgi:mono/diheme cytochrome c family protein
LINSPPRRAALRWRFLFLDDKGFVVGKIRSIAVFISLSLCAALAIAQAPAAPAAAEPVPTFDPAYLANPKALATGKEVWDTQCRHCHGNAAYPGKAPKLAPGSMEPDFIFDRVTYGFRKMPPWKDVFTIEQRKAVVAYIKSTSFSP